MYRSVPFLSSGIFNSPINGNLRISNQITKCLYFINSISNCFFVFYRTQSYSNHQNWRHTAGRGAFSAAEAPKTQEALMAFKFLGQRQLGKLPSRWVSTILMVAINVLSLLFPNVHKNVLYSRLSFHILAYWSRFLKQS